MHLSYSAGTLFGGINSQWNRLIELQTLHALTCTIGIGSNHMQVDIAAETEE